MTETPPVQPTPLLAPQFVPAEVEGAMYQRWVDRKYFEVDASSGKPPFTIVIPPPNVTGNLHLGHAFEHTLIDALVRRRRMQGYEALWLPGMDHAGIATQNVVERELAKEGRSRHDVGREAFVERVWEWKERSGGLILSQMRRLGDGVAWDRERFTMDAGLSTAVHTMFKRMFDDGLIYRAERIINWCPRCHTALSDIEVEHSEDEGELVSLRYGAGEDSIVVATTRAETMLGDTAVAVHPDDERYRHLVGRTIALPLTDRRIPVIADEHVDPEFGTGAVKVTPAHDPNDFAIGQRHHLPSVTMMDDTAIITVPGPFFGLDRYEARPAVVAALRAEGRIVAEIRPYLHSVGHCSRCTTTVEPRLSLQWFVGVGPLAKAAGDAVRDGRVRVHPAELEPRWFAWVDSMHDWCISRQLWWGHRIPVWYGPDGEVVCVGPDEAPPTGEGWRQDDDVLDTWFSSGLWPFSTLGWPQRTAEIERFYPTSVLVTGYDILFFWVARMMMFGLYAMDGVAPFSTIALHGMVRDQHGKKMSKSFGNVVDPLEWIDRYGADALRFTLARGANPGTDVPIGEDWVQGSRNFTTKLWNAGRFALANGVTSARANAARGNGATSAPASGAITGAAVPPSQALSVADRWILSRLSETVREVDRLYEDFQFAKAADALYHFAWDELCDWYLELAKVPLAADGPAADATRSVLGHVLDVLLRMLHPIIPFVTEELWTALTGGESLVIATWPEPELERLDPDATRRIDELMRVVTEIRRFRSDQGLRPGQRVPAKITGLADAGLSELNEQLRSLARLDEPSKEFAVSASLDLGGVSLDLDLSGTVDVGAERRRLDKELAAARQELDTCAAKLANADFLAKAPAAVVEKITGRQAAAQADLARVCAQLDRLGAA